MGQRKQQKPPVKRQQTDERLILASSPLSKIAETAELIEKRQQLQINHTKFEGPLPHPDIFRLYGEIIPDAPERILRVFEEDSRYLRTIQAAALDAQKQDNKRVHWMAYSLIFFGYLLAAFFAWLGKDWLAGIILATTLGGTITGYLQNKKV